MHTLCLECATNGAVPYVNYAILRGPSGTTYTIDRVQTLYTFYEDTGTMVMEWVNVCVWDSETGIALELPDELTRDGVVLECLEIEDDAEPGYYCDCFYAEMDGTRITVRDGYEDKTIVGIGTDSDGTKYIHYYGYGYQADDNGSGKCYRFLEYTWYIEPLTDVLSEGVCMFESNHSDGIKTYIRDCTELEMIDCYAHYDNGKAPRILKEITINTPDGTYAI